MGISKTIWSLQSEVEHIDNLLNMSSDEFYVYQGYDRPTSYLKQQKAKLENELKDATAVGVRKGLVNAKS